MYLYKGGLSGVAQVSQPALLVIVRVHQILTYDMVYYNMYVCVCMYNTGVIKCIVSQGQQYMWVYS